MKKSAGQKAGMEKRTQGKVQGLFVQIWAELVGAERPVWREFTVARDVTLPEVHTILQILFEWETSHLFNFEVGKLRYGEDAEGGELDYFDVEIGEIAENAKKMTYRYDFGDDWEVLLKLTKTDESDGDLIWLSGGEGAGPLEDCGGIDRHNEIVAALQGGKRLDPELREWIPEDYDPERFDLQAMRKELAGLEVAIDHPDLDAFDEDDDVFTDLETDDLAGFPLDEFGEPVLYDPNDRRGPDPERWKPLSEDDKLRSIIAYHSGDPMLEDQQTFSLHCTLHATIETQVVENSPKQVRQALDRLTADGRGRRHTAVHLVGVGFVEMVQRQVAGDERAEEAYERWLEGLPSDSVERWNQGEDLPELPRLGTSPRPKGKRKKGRKR